MQERLDYELGVITKTGYAGYFLIVADFIKAAREKGIPVGPGRGSAAGSLVAYALRITDVCPLKFDLLFERFLNPERVSMPDIDVDFCDERRGEVIDYVREKYGRDSVGQIITFGTLKSRAAIKDVGRVLGFTPAETDAIAKLIPNQPNFSLTVKEAIAKVPEVRKLYDGTSATSSCSTSRSRSKASRATPGSTPPASSSRRDRSTTTSPSARRTRRAPAPERRRRVVVTQYDMNALEKAGMLKMDFLGLTTLTIIHDAIASIKERAGRAARSRGARRSTTKPRIACCARAAPSACSSSSRRSPPTWSAPCAATASTTSSRATRSCAPARSTPACTRVHAAEARRGAGHVRAARARGDPRADVRRHHLPGTGDAHRAAAGGHLARRSRRAPQGGREEGRRAHPRRSASSSRRRSPGRQARIIADTRGQIETFGRYGFNKSHSVAYTVLSYHTAWLKVHYPAEFMAALLSACIGDADAW